MMTRTRSLRMNLLMVGILTISTVALAGQEFDAAKTKANNEAQLNLAKIQQTCGCQPKLVIGAMYREKEDLRRVPFAAEEAAAAAGAYCGGGDKYKKAFCASITTVQVDYAEMPGPAVLEKLTLKLQSNRFGYTGRISIGKVLDPLAG